MNKKTLTISDVQQLHQNGNLEGAKTGYLNLLKINPQNVEALHSLGILYVEKGDYLTALDYLTKAVAISPHDASLKLHLANVYKAKGDYLQAQQMLMLILEENPDSAAGFNNLGTVFYAQQKWLEAIESYKSAIDIRPDFVDAYYNLGLAMNKAGMILQAINVYQSLLELAPEHSAGRFQLGCLFMQQNKYQAAIDQLSIVEEEHPFHFETQTNLATIFLKLGWLDKAKSHYLKALKMMPEDEQIIFNLGVIALQQAQTHEAIEYYQRALKLNPNHFEAHNNLGVAFLYVKKRENALHHFREALRIQPHNEAVRHTINILSQDEKLSSTPIDYVRSLFNSYADHYDAHINQVLHYEVPKQIYEMIHPKYDEAIASWDILDLGCGTGLCAQFFKISHSITGVDIAEAMLDIAKQKNIYTNVVHSEILSYLEGQQQAYDLIIAGDVLVYFGELKNIFSATHQALRPKGLFIFNVEIGNENGYDMTESGRFAHSKSYIESLIKEFNFETLDYKAIHLRSQEQSSVKGHLYLLRK